jgi:hypothetical protein
MSTRLENLIASSRESRDLDAVWDLDRSERVREGALRRRDVRTRRDRALRRGALVAGGAGLLVLALLRAAASASIQVQGGSASLQVQGGSAPLDPETEIATTASSERAIAFRTLADAGYARD